MKRVDSIVLKETKYIAFWVLIFSIILQAIFLVIKKWDYTVLLGNLLSGSLTVLNFFLMGLSVQKALSKDEKEAKTVIKFSQTYRTLLFLVIIAVGVVLSCFNTFAVIIPLFFTRISIAIRPLIKKEEQ